MKTLLKVIWVTFQSLTKLHWILFNSKNNSRFLITSELQCGLQSVKHCPSMLAEETNHGAFADTISCMSKDDPLSNKFPIWQRNVTTSRKPQRTSFKGKRIRYSAFVQKMAESSSELHEKILKNYSKNL